MGAGISSLLDISRRALATQSQTVRVIGNNIANVNTEGYSRRKTEIVATQSLDLAGGAFGTGADIESVRRMTDFFLVEEQLLRIHDRSFADIRDQFLSRAEGMFSVDQDAGRIGYELSQFFSTLEDLQANPSSIPLRSALVEQGQTLTTTINNTYTVLADLQRESDRRMEVLVGEVNRYSGEIAQLNSQIVSGERGLQQNLTLRDEREQRLRELAELVAIQTTETADGEMIVTLGNGFGLVTGVSSNDLEYTRSPDFEPVAGYPTGLDGGELGFIVYDFDKSAGSTSHINLTDVVAAGGGEISGLLSLRGTQSTADTMPFDANGVLVDMASHVETIARDLLTRFNMAYLGSFDEDSGTAYYDPSSGDLAGNSPGVFGLFSAVSAPTDLDANGRPEATDLLDSVNYASQLIFNVNDPSSLAFAEDLDSTDGVTNFVDGDGTVISALLAERAAIVDYQATYQIGSVQFTGTIEELYDTSVTVAGGAASNASNQLIIAQDREQQINESLASISGVSLDEELATLINFQRAFEASARMISVGDELLAQVLSLLG